MRNMAIMKPDTYVIASGNLATSQRTINGLLGQLALLAIDRKRALADRGADTIRARIAAA